MFIFLVLSYKYILKMFAPCLVSIWKPVLALSSCDRSGQPQEMFFLFQAEECKRLHTTDYPALILSLHAKPTQSLSLSIYEGLGDLCCFGAHRNVSLGHMKDHHFTRSRRLMSNLITFVSKFQLKQTWKAWEWTSLVCQHCENKLVLKTELNSCKFFCINVLFGKICLCV